MMKKFKKAVMVYDDVGGHYNVGDYVQSLAAQGFVGKPDYYINRERASKFSEENAKLIMNGWFTHTKNNSWIPSEKIDPLFVAFHINSNAVDSILSKEGISYLKKHQPIGCRDINTLKLLESVGIKAYFSGCLTLTLDRYKKENIERKGIYIVDPLYNYPQSKYMFSSMKQAIKGVIKGDILKLNKLDNHLSKIFTKELLCNAHYECQVLPSQGVSHDRRFEHANNLLEKYSTAELVITSRIHCALPCLAMGTPVIYVNGFDNFVDTCRFEGILDLFNRIDVDPKSGKFKTNFDFSGSKIDKDVKIVNKNDYLRLADDMKEICLKFI